MSKNKKPTMMEVKNVINNLIQETSELRKGVNQLDYILNYYIKFNGHEEKFVDFLEKESRKDTKEKEDKNVVLPDRKSEKTNENM